MFFLVLFCCCFWIIPSSDLLMCPGLYHFSGPDYAVSPSCLCVGSGVETYPAEMRLGTEWLPLDICPQATWVTGKERVQIQEARCCAGKSWEVGMRGEVCTEPLPCRTLSYLHNHPVTLQDWIASLSHFTGEKTEALRG